MIELLRIRNNKEQVAAALLKRNILAEPILNDILLKDSQWRSRKQELDSVLEEANGLAKEIGPLMAKGEHEKANELKSRNVELKSEEATLKAEVDRLEKEINGLLFQLPNTPTEEVKRGNDSNDNEVVYESGVFPDFSFNPKPHWDLAKEKELIDFELGVKVTGAGFPFYRGKGAKLQRALISFFLDEAGKAGYEEFQAPLFVNEASAFGTGQLPDKEGQMYHDDRDDLYLIPTAEVPLTNIFRDVLIPNPSFSYKLCGYTPCFRREAGSYGKDVRGLNRLHQFDKVEIVRIEHPNNTSKALEEMVSHVKGLLEKLELPYRVLRLCGGDMGFASAMTYDFEVYSAAQEKWLEVSSVSRFDTFQSNRLKLRFKDEDKKNRLCHTLNGSALALPRIVAALLENHQTAAGAIKIPEALIPYTQFDVL
ncbi:MAG: serine--tRNA ligase [Flavobacteriia bacterium]|nr:serine--tRNA ligase [Flavobacteriia bacterium]